MLPAIMTISFFLCFDITFAQCPTITPNDISGSYCNETNAAIEAGPLNVDVTYSWSSSNSNIAIADPSASSTSVIFNAPTTCQIESADISLIATCNSDGHELFNGVVSTVQVYPTPPDDLASFVTITENTCDEPVILEGVCETFITLTPDPSNPTFPVLPGDSGTASYSLTYMAPGTDPDCCVPVDDNFAAADGMCEATVSVNYMCICEANVGNFSKRSGNE